MVETSNTSTALPDTSPAPQSRYQLRPRTSPTSVKSAPILKTTPKKSLRLLATPAQSTEVVGSLTPHTQPISSASLSATPETSASPTPILLTSAPSPNIYSQANPLSVNQPTTVEMTCESQQGSLSFNVEPEYSTSTAPFMTASVPVQPAVSASLPVQPVLSAPATTGHAEHMDRFLAEAAGPWAYPHTPQSEKSTPVSDPGTRRALLFSAGQGSTTPADVAVQGFPGPSAAGTSVAPSQISCSSSEYRRRMYIQEQQILQSNRRMSEQEAELQKYQAKQEQMEQLLQQLQRQLQQTSAVQVQPSITVARINPQPVTSTVTPTTVNQPGMGYNGRVQSLPATVVPDLSHPAISVSHVSLPQHVLAAKDMVGQPVIDKIPMSAPIVPIYPVSYAAVVQPTMIPPAIVRHVQPAHIPAVQPSSNVALPSVPTVPVTSAVDLVSDQQSDMPSVTLQDMPASDFLQQFVQACRYHKSPKTQDSQIKFKMESGDRVQGVNLRRGERLTSALVLQWVGTARTLDSAAMKARSRAPETPTEWATYMKFYVDHMEDGLQEVMMTKVSTGAITSVEGFWNAVFSELFPAALVKDAFEEAMKEYPIWAEPLGLERWEKVTKLLVQYREVVAGNTGDTLELAIAETLYQQLVRVIHQCKERPSQDLLRQLAMYQAPLNLAKATDRKPSVSEYIQTFKGFMLWLSDWLKLYSYEGTFGYPMTAVTGTLQSSSKKYLRHMETISTPARRDSTPRKPPFQKSKLPQLAPTGKLRTWTWKQRTCPDNAPREECATPASAEAQAKGCEYLGDWLDLQGLCTYCCKSGHVKEDCPKHKANRAKWEAAQKKLLEATPAVEQEN